MLEDGPGLISMCSPSLKTPRLPRLPRLAEAADDAAGINRPSLPMVKSSIHGRKAKKCCGEVIFFSMIFFTNTVKVEALDCLYVILSGNNKIERGIEKRNVVT